MPTNYRQIKAIEKKNKERLLNLHPNIPDTSGIYIFMRQEGGIKYAYVGQAKHLLTRMAQHLSGYQYIDLSIKKHGLYSEKNPCGWDFVYVCYPEEKLNDYEQEYIKLIASKGYQLRNKTSGSQGKGKTGIAENKPARGYHDGLHQGYKNARRDVAHLFEKYLNYSTKSDKPNKNQEKALQKFKDFITLEENKNEKE